MNYTLLERRDILIKDPYIGMPIHLDTSNGSCLENYPIAMSYVPFQQWKSTYPLEKALERGTLFPELDLPFFGGNTK